MHTQDAVLSLATSLPRCTDPREGDEFPLLIPDERTCDMRSALHLDEGTLCD